MRTILLCALALWCSPAWGERINVEGASADFNTRDEMFRIVGILTGHPDLTTDIFGVDFSNFDDRYWVQNTIRTGNPPRFVRGDQLYLIRGSYWPTGEIITPLTYTVEDRDAKCFFSIEFDANLMNLPDRLAQGRDPTFVFSFDLAHEGISDSAGGQSTVNNPMFVPEPSAGALAGIGVVALLCHLFLRRRPGFRVGGAKRHIAGEPADKGV